MSSPRSRRRISEIIFGGKLLCLITLSYVKWSMASFRCYGNSDLDEMYSIFHLSLARR